MIREEIYVETLTFVILSEYMIRLPLWVSNLYNFRKVPPSCWPN
jgi:hypothetical protein